MVPLICLYYEKFIFWKCWFFLKTPISYVCYYVSFLQPVICVVVHVQFNWFVHVKGVEWSTVLDLWLWNSLKFLAEVLLDFVLSLFLHCGTGLTLFLHMLTTVLYREMLFDEPCSNSVLAYDCITLKHRFSYDHRS